MYTHRACTRTAPPSLPCHTILLVLVLVLVLQEGHPASASAAAVLGARSGSKEGGGAVLFRRVGWAERERESGLGSRLGRPLLGSDRRLG